MTRSPGEIERNRFYNSARWKKFRAWFLQQHPLCAECEKRGFFVPAVELDHIVSLAKSPDRGLDPDNVQGLCKSCHSGKTREEQTGRKSRHWSAGRTGVDGLPLSPDHKWNRERGED